MKIIKKVLLVSLLFLIPNIIYAEEYKSGDLRNPIITVEDKNLIVTKKVIPTDKDMIYDVQFELEGKPTLLSSKKDIYVSILFDNSGSMLCKKGTKLSSINVFDKSVVINGKTVYCDAFDTVNLDKWNNATLSTVKFSNDLLTNVDTANINLFTFSTSAIEKTDWSREVLEEGVFGIPNGATNLDLAVNSAVNKLKDISNDAIKVIVIISDGEPTNYEKAKDAIDNAKSAGIEIYTVGYDTSSYAKDTLMEFSSGEGYYFDSNLDEINSVLKKISSSIESKISISDILIKDTIGNSFLFDSGMVNYNDRIVEYKINDIDSGKVSFNFKIKLNDNVSDGWHKTNEFFNNGVLIKYKDIDNNEKKLLFNDSSEVYFEREKASYVVNYYKDEINNDNFLGSVEEVVDVGFILTKDLINKDKYLPVGYNSENVLLQDLVISNINDNVINILYLKNKYSYHVEYYKDEISKTNLIAKSKDFYCEYNSTISDLVLSKDLGENYVNLYIPLGYQSGYVLNPNHLIDLDNNVIKILYLKKDNLTYRVEYYFDGIKDESKTSIINNQVFNSKIDNINFLKFSNYELDEVINYPLVISDDSSNNVIKIYYKSKENIVLPPKTNVDFSCNRKFNISIVTYIDKKYAFRTLVQLSHVLP